MGQSVSGTMQSEDSGSASICLTGDQAPEKDASNPKLKNGDGLPKGRSSQSFWCAPHANFFSFD